MIRTESADRLEQAVVQSKRVPLDVLAQERQQAQIVHELEQTACELIARLIRSFAPGLPDDEVFSSHENTSSTALSLEARMRSPL